MAQFRRSVIFGTEPAIITMARVGHISNEKRSGWGGARNDAVSRSMSLAQVMALRDAAERAIAAGLAFNRFVTIHWEALGVQADDRANAERTQHLRQYVGSRLAAGDCQGAQSAALQAGDLDLANQAKAYCSGQPGK